MAGTSPGARAPFPLSIVQTPTGVACGVPTTTRTRRCHGVFSISSELAVVYSSRRSDDVRSVQLVLGHEGPVFTGGMSPTQARAVARALVAAADSAEVQRNWRA